MIYCHAILPRAGLGNRLFPWARCCIYSHLHGIPMLSPIWAQIKIGPLLRGESDRRFYASLFKKRRDDIAGLKRLWLQLVSTKIPEPDDLRAAHDMASSKHIGIIFEGEQGHFRKLNGWDRFLRKEILAMTRGRWLQELDAVGDVPISINVRRGDFAEPETEEDFYTKGLLRTPLPWFIESLTKIRETLGFPARAVVVSDGTYEELKDLLHVENVTYVETGGTISDLLVLAKGRIFIASGNSSFSAWASFLGQMPTITHPGQSFSWFQLENRKGHYVGEFRPSSPAQLFIDQVQAMQDDLLPA